MPPGLRTRGSPTTEGGSTQVSCQGNYLWRAALCGSEFLEGRARGGIPIPEPSSPLLSHGAGDGADVFNVGDHVIRKGLEVTVVKVDYTVEPPSYVIRTPDGREVGTERSKLAPLHTRMAATVMGEDATRVTDPRSPSPTDRHYTPTPHMCGCRFVETGCGSEILEGRACGQM